MKLIISLYIIYIFNIRLLIEKKIMINDKCKKLILEKIYLINCLSILDEYHLKKKYYKKYMETFIFNLNEKYIKLENFNKIKTFIRNFHNNKQKYANCKIKNIESIKKKLKEIDDNILKEEEKE